MTLLTVIIITLILAAAVQARDTNNLPTQIAKSITATWTCQDAIGQKRTKAGNVWAKHSRAYRQWQLGLWTGRLNGCRHQLELYEGVVAQLESGLASFYRQAGAGNTGPMTGTGRTLERIGRKHGVSPYFIAAVSITESSAGLAACSNNRFNVWGLSSCGSGWYVPPFRSWTEAIGFYSRFLTGRWPSATTTMHYYGYARDSHKWGRKTAEHMRRWFGVDNGVRYP